MINGERVKQARELRGLTQAALAKRIDVLQSTISKIESGQIQPTEQTLQGIIFQCGFPLAFFQQETTVDFPLGSLLYRARASLTKVDREQALQYARTVYEEFSFLARRIRKIPISLPRVSDDPQTAARLTRSALGLSPDSPIENLIRSIERAGVIVLGLPRPLKNVDAFSTWVVRQEMAPVMLLSATTSGDRLRYSVAHELGHLVMHHMIQGEISRLETEADEFAAELLMPAEAMRREFRRPITVPLLLRLKQRWKVSIQALARRAHDLKILSLGQYKYLMKQISKMGWRKSEPGPISIEKPRALRKMAELVYGVPLDYRRLASAMNHPLALVRETLEAHAGKSALIVDRAAATSTKVLNFQDFAKQRAAELP